MIYKSLKTADSEVRTMMAMLEAAIGNQSKLCRILQYSQSTWIRKKEDPGKLTLADLRKIVPYCRKYHIEFDVMGVIQ